MKCRVCSFEEQAEKLTAREMYLGTRDVFDYFLCRKCRPLSIGELPENLSDYYAKYYINSSLSLGLFSYRKFLKKYVILHSDFLAKILAKLLTTQDEFRIRCLCPLALDKTSRILDVGCGSGSLARELISYGFRDVTGVDPFLAKDYNSKHLKPQKTTVFSLSQKFDLIVIIIRMPNVDSYSFRKFKENWFSIHAPFHLFLPSHQGLNQLLKDEKMEIISTQNEQLVDFFLHSESHALNVCDYEADGTRRFLESRFVKRTPPLFNRLDIKKWKAKSKQVKKHNMTDWIVYYIIHKCL